jgi:hypothetical protein
VKHDVPVLGGMFGIKKGALAGEVSITGLVSSAFTEQPEGLEGAPGEDQAFLAKYLWPLVSGQTVDHDIFDERCKRYGAPHCLAFPSGEERDGHSIFVGQPFEGYDGKSKAKHVSQYKRCTFTCLV